MNKVYQFELHYIFKNNFKGLPRTFKVSIYMRGMVVIYQYYLMSHIDND